MPFSQHGCRNDKRNRRLVKPVSAICILKKNEGKLQECWTGSWNQDPSWTIDLHLLTRGFWLFPQAKRTLKEASFTSCQPVFRGFVCDQRRKCRSFRCVLTPERTGREDFSWPLARRTWNTALTLTTEDLGIVDKQWLTHEITHLYAHIILKFLPQWIGYYS